MSAIGWEVAADAPWCDGLGNVLTNDMSKLAAPTLSEAVQTSLQLKGLGKAKDIP